MTRRKASRVKVDIRELVANYFKLSPAEQDEVRDDLAVALIDDREAYDLDEAYELIDDPATLVKQVWSLDQDVDVDEETVARFLEGRPDLHAVGFDSATPGWVKREMYVSGKGFVPDPNTEVDGTWVEGFWVGPNAYQDEDLVTVANRISLFEYLDQFPLVADDWRHKGGQLNFKISEDEWPDAETYRPSLVFLILYNWFLGLEDYPLADDNLHSLLEMEDVAANVADATGRFVREDWRLLYPDRPESGKLEHADEAGYSMDEVPGWTGLIESAIFEADENALEPRGGRGGYPNDDDVRDALTATKLWSFDEIQGSNVVTELYDQLDEQEQAALEDPEVQAAIKNAIPSAYIEQDEDDLLRVVVYNDDLLTARRIVQEHAYPGQTKMFD